MTDILLQIGATKLALAVVLAGVVWLVTRRVGRPAIAHSLWLLVLGAILVPAVVPLRVLPGEAAVGVAAQLEVGSPVVEYAGADGQVGGLDGVVRQNAKPLVVLVWLLGSAGFFGWTLVRTVRFQRTLTSAAHPAPRLQRIAAEIGDTLGLPRVPRVYTTGARVRPMVWWAGGPVRILIPAVFLTDLDETELRTVLAHELAHVRRRDYLVRIVEWLACSAYWWNPVVWWARRELRSAEESSCDILAVCAVKSTRGRYARSLLRVVEVMSAGRVERTPALASAADVGRDSRRLEKRLRTVLATAQVSPSSRWVRTSGKVALAGALSLGLVYCATAERSAVPETGQSQERARPEAQAVAPVDEYRWLLFDPDTIRSWVVLWDLESTPPSAILLRPASAAELPFGCVPGVSEGRECIVLGPEDLPPFAGRPGGAFLADHRYVLGSSAHGRTPHSPRRPW